MAITALEAADPRTAQLRVAGPGALLVANLHKLADRQGSPSRLDDKDALDLYRLLHAIPTETLASALETLVADTLSGAISEATLGFLQDLFGSADALGAR